MGRGKKYFKEQSKNFSNTNNNRDSDLSDFDSIAHSSATGDFDQTEDDDLNGLPISIDSFSDTIEHLQNKQVAVRLKAASNICNALKKSCMSETLDKWKNTLCGLIEKNLKKTVEEATKNCTLASLISLQLGVEVEEEIKGILSTLLAILSDETQPNDLRCACVQALGLCVYLSCDQVNILHEVLQTVKTVFFNITLTLNNVNFFTAALFSWILLLQRCNSSYIILNIEEVQPKLCQFLDDTLVDVRIAAGEVIAILYEIAIINIDEDFCFKNHEYLKELISKLAIDSAKYRAKRDKKVQKFSFRQINDAIFNNRFPQTQVKFNQKEVLNVNGCHFKLLYDLLCQLLKGDLNLHLSKNEILRDLFDLGPIVNLNFQQLTKEEKMEQKNLYDASTKARKMYRAKQRDKKKL